MKFYDINRRYKQGDLRINYSYKNETKEIYDMMDSYEPNGIGYSTYLKYDTDVFSNCFIEPCKQFIGENTAVNIHTLLGNTVFDDSLIVRGNPIYNVGFVKIKETGLNEHIYKNNKNLLLNSNIPVNFNQKYDNIKTEIVKREYAIGDPVNICIKNNISIIGEIIDINDEDYIITIDSDTDIEESEQIRINKNDNNITISKIVPLNQTCVDQSLSVYLYDNKSVDGNDLDNYLNKIIPDFERVLNSIDGRDKYTTLDEFKNKMYRYGYDLDTITGTHFNKITTILNNNNKTRKKLSKPKDNTEDVPPEKKNLEFINNYSLDQVSYYYGDYPYFNTNIDSDNVRLSWLQKTYDSGALFYKNIRHNINKKFLENSAKRLSSLRKVHETLHDSKTKITNKLDNELDKLKGDINCGGLRLVKTYTDINKLQLDNNREVLIEEDKLIEGETTNKVQPGHYAILIENFDQKKIYKRQKIQGSDMWVVEKDLGIDMIISSYKDFCVQQGMSIEEIDTTFLKGKNKCKYSEHYKRCLPVKIINLKTELDHINRQIYDINDNNEVINRKDEVIQEQEDELLFLKHELEANNNKRLNIESYRIKYNIKEKEEDVYQYHYYRIDRYLENIKHLPLNSFYTSLELLLDKYGRIGSEIDGENVHFYYSRPGSKKIICHHHSKFIDYNNKIITYTEALDNIINEYGVEQDGYIWCRNCGEQINGSEYETQEAFMGTGARDVTHEVLDNIEVYKSEENTEIVEILRKSLLYGDDKSITNQSLSVIKIIHVLTNILGITLSNNDELNILTLCNTIESKIKSKSSWIQIAKKKQKKASISFLENVYNNYKIRNIILYTTAILFVFIQSGIPEYTVTKTFANCKPSLRGYPLDKEHRQEGIDYMACVLDSLSSLGVDWSSIKKIKTKENLITKIDEMYQDPVIKYRYDNKKKYLREQDKDKQEYSYEWNEFRPPLDPYEIEIKELTPFSSNIEKHIREGNISKVSSEIEKMYEFEKTVNLKLIEEIDIQIMENKIVNKKFIPTPLDNLCCLQNINSSNSYMSYFVKQNTSIQELIRIIYDYNNTKQLVNTLLEDSKMFIRSEILPTLLSFNRNIGIDRDELTEGDIQKLYLNYIDHGLFEGQKHIYEHNYCVITGESQDTIISRKYKKEDYYTLLNKVNNKKLIHIDNTEFKEIEDKISHVIDSNIYLQGNKYLSSFNEKLKKNKNKKLVWDDMKEQIQIESEEISKQIGDKLNMGNTESIKNILLSLGEKRKVLETDLKYMPEEEAYTKFHIDKVSLVQSFILNYLKNTIYKIKNNKSIIDPYIPEEWTLDTNLIDKYNNIIKDNNKTTQKYLYLNKTHIHIFEKLIDIIKGTTNNIKILRSSLQIFICDKQNPGELNSNIGYFLHYIFLLIVSQILEIKHDIDIEESEFIVKGDEDEDEEDEEEEFNISRALKQKNEIEAQIIYDILTTIQKDTLLQDKLTQDHIKEVIEKKGETLKEDTLRFVQELDEETWASLKMRISVGLDTWATISSKKKNNYTFDTNIGDNETISTNNDSIERDRLQAQTDLGDNYTEDQYQQWITERDRNQQEDMLVHQERDVMEDDDGDEY